MDAVPDAGISTLSAESISPFPPLQEGSDGQRKANHCSCVMEAKLHLK